MKTAKEIVTDLSDWSKKYPRGRVWGFNTKNQMDGELIAIEKDAVEYCGRNEKELQHDPKSCALYVDYEKSCQALKQHKLELGQE